MNIKLLALGVLMGLAAICQAEYMALTDTKGRTIEAKLIRFDSRNKTVILERKGRRGATTVPISVFTQKDQKKIISWSQGQTFLSDSSFAIDVKRIKKKSGENASEYGGMATKSYNHHFNIVLKNKSTTNFENIEVEYVIFYTQEVHFNNRTEMKAEDGTLYEKVSAHVPARSTKELETKTIKLQTYRESGFDLTWPDLDGDMHGIIIKLSTKNETGKTITRQIVYPDNLKKRWTNKTVNKQAK